MTTLAEFMLLVKTMREAQIAYFRKPHFDAQSAAMKLEREVDRVMKEHDGGQGKLFGGPSAPPKSGGDW